MGSHWCVSVNRHTTLDLTKYDPAGIAAAVGISAITLVCLACIFIDILNGFRRKKLWLPCQFFALNALTLSLLALAATYASNRTTLMLSAAGQLCKLSATVLICVCMGFFMPSVGVEKGSENIKNLAALTILVLTIEFNMIAQLITGTIFSFVWEHGVVLFFMFVLLLILWTDCFLAFRGKNNFNKHKKEGGGTKTELKTTGEMLSRLEWYYIYGYTCNPQLLLGLVTHCATIGLICTLCALSLLETALGTLVVTEMKSCDRSHNSRWEMQMVLGIQIVTIVVGISGIWFRWFTMLGHFKLVEAETSSQKGDYKLPYHNLFPLPWNLPSTFSFKAYRLRETFITLVLSTMAKGFDSVTYLVLVLSLGLRRIFQCGKKSETGLNSFREEHFRDAIQWRGHEVLVDWMLKTAVQDMDRLIEENKKKAPTNLIQLLLKRSQQDECQAPTNLIQLLLKLKRSQQDECQASQQDECQAPTNLIQLLLKRSQQDECQAPTNLKRSQQDDVEWDINPYAAVEDECHSRYSLSCLSMVILARLVDVLIPSCRSLIGALNECFDIIYLIDKSTLTENDQDERRFALAQDLWMSTDFKCHWFFKKNIKPSIERCDKKSGITPLAAARQVIEELMKTPEKEHLEGFDLHAIAKLIICVDNVKKFDSLDKLHEFLEKLFVEMFYFFLGKLPKVIENCVFKSSIEECGDRSRYVMELVCKVQQLENRIGQLKFCEGKAEVVTNDSGNHSDMGSDETV